MNEHSFASYFTRLVAASLSLAEVVWRNGSRELSIQDAPYNQPLALEFRFSNGDLYAFQVVD